MAYARVRQLRKTMTRQEVKLWLKLREPRSIGYHFGRQSPLSLYIVDFECRPARLVVEIDGHQHGFEEIRRRDIVRDRALEQRGYKILRYSNGEADGGLDGVLESIRLALEAATTPRPAVSRPPSPGGEG